MKKIVTPVLILLFVSTAFFCSNAQSSNNMTSYKKSENTKTVEVYYFHRTRRCATCIAVGDVSRKLVEEKYGKNANVKYIEINIDEPGNEELVEKFQVSGSGLYVYNGKDIENITAYGFQYARTKPDKLRNKLMELINKNL